MSSFDMTLRSLPRPDHYHRLVHKVCRLLCTVQGCDNYGDTVDMEEGCLVFVYGGEYVERPGDRDDHFRYTIGLLKPSGREDPRKVSYDGAAACMLEPEPGVIDWCRADQLAAQGQSWDIFYCDGSEGPLWQLQKHDDDGRFDQDSDAWEFVWRRATEDGCPLARRALSFLYYRSPKEYREIRKHCTLPNKEDAA